MKVRWETKWKFLERIFCRRSTWSFYNVADFNDDWSLITCRSHHSTPFRWNNFIIKEQKLFAFSCSREHAKLHSPLKGLHECAPKGAMNTFICKWNEHSFHTSQHKNKCSEWDEKIHEIKSGKEREKHSANPLKKWNCSKLRILIVFSLATGRASKL